MRSADELIFRVGQEVANLRLWLQPPSSHVIPATPRPRLADPAAIVERLRGTRFSSDVERLAELVMQHRFPSPGGILETGQHIEWRRDYRTNVISERQYFRLIPYLDVRRAGDHKAIWDLSRHQHLVVLAQAFLFTERGEFLDEIGRQVESWLDDNPYMRGINWTSALEVAFRALSWMWVLHLAGARLPQPITRKMSLGLYQHGRYLEHNLSVYFSPNTHLLGEAVALHALGTVFPELPRAERWRQSGARVVRREMTRQVREDGSHFEQSSYYHVYALDLFLFHHILAGAGEDAGPLRRMADYLDALMGPTRTLPLIGDDDGGRVFHPYGRCDRFGRASLATCALLLNEPKWAYDETAMHEQAVWWLGARCDEQPKRPAEVARSQDASRLFRESGMAVLRSGAVHVLVDAGPFGPGSGGHSHSDTLSIFARDGAEEILSDAGTYTYVAEPELRDWFRGSAAHNTLKIGGRDQATPAGPFRWLDKPQVEILEQSSTPQHELIDAVCRYQPPDRAARFVHRRRVLLIKAVPGGQLDSDLLIVCDMVQGVQGVQGVEGGTGLHRLEQFWHPGETTLREGAGQFRIGTKSCLFLPDGSQFDVEEGWRSRAFGEKSRASMLVARQQCALPAVMWAALRIGGTRTNDGRFLVASADGNTVALNLHDGTRIKVEFECRKVSMTFT